MSVTVAAIDNIKRMILSGELKAGQRLPREQDLAVQLGLSRSSLREAVRALSLMRVLDVRQGDGTYISSLEPALIMESTGFLAEMVQDHSLLEVFEVRRVLEAMAARMAAILRSDDHLAQLRECMRLMDEAPTLDEQVLNDIQFHHVINLAAGNQVLTTLLQGLSNRTARARMWRGRTEAQGLERTRQGHVAIYDALIARDPDRAEAAALLHVSESQAWVRQTLQAETEEA
ncbi:MAG: FadR/GntR family transcriptional regulator [Candidatus Dormibacteria bacterium]